MYWVRVSTVRLPRAIHSVSTTSTSVTTGGKASRSVWSQAECGMRVYSYKNRSFHFLSAPMGR